MMLHFPITVSNIGDIQGKSTDRPLNARSLALSVLLGTHPPTLSARSFVAFAELFDINGGTMRTALSRMVAAGDLSVDDGSYTLSPRLQQRQAAQDAGRASPAPWDGAWHTAIAIADHRDLADRRRVRAVMENARFAELRPTVWMRPANLPVPPLGEDAADWLVTTGTISGRPGDDISRRLWDLGAISTAATALSAMAEDAVASMDLTDARQIPGAFALSARIVRFLRSEPLLPTDLTPTDWPVPGLRDRYGTLERSLQTMMRPFLRAHERTVTL